MNRLLSPVDTNFWSLDTSTTRQVIASLCLLGSLPERSRIVEAFRALLDSLPLLRCRISGTSKYFWEVDEAFDIEHHVTYIHRPEISDRDELLLSAGTEFSKGIPKDAPQWKVVVISNYTSEVPAAGVPQVALLFMVHHAFADGLGGLELFDAACSSSADEIPKAIVRRADAAKAIGRPVQSAHGRLHDVRSALRLLKDGLSAPGESPLNGANSAERRILLTDYPFEEMQTLRRRFGVSLNDLMLTLVAGAVRRYHAARQRPIHDLRILMPVSLRGLAERLSLGNQVSGVGVRLPVSVSDPQEQLKRVREYINRIKQEGSYGAFEFLARISAKLPHSIRQRVCESAARRTNFICTSISAAVRPRYIGGARIEGNYGIAALMRGQGIAFAFTRYERKICISLVSDPQIVQEPSSLISYLLESGKELSQNLTQDHD